MPVVDVPKLLKSASTQLLPDGKDQFETVAQYEARQVSRRVAWIESNRFFVLQLGLANGSNVYNSETQNYTLDKAGDGVTLTPKGSYISSGYEKIAILGKLNPLQTQMNQNMAKDFYGDLESHSLFYIATPIAPYRQQSGYDFENKYALTAAVACRFVKNINNQRVIYFSKP